MGLFLCLPSWGSGVGQESTEQGPCIGGHHGGQRRRHQNQPNPGARGGGGAAQGRKPPAQRSRAQFSDKLGSWGACLHTAPGPPHSCRVGGKPGWARAVRRDRRGQRLVVCGAVRRRRQERTLPLTLYIKNIHSSCAQNSIIHMRVSPASLLGPGTALKERGWFSFSRAEETSLSLYGP